MSGNIWEWCWDYFDSKYYENSPVENPKGPDSGTSHLLRGGSKSSVWDYCKNYERAHAGPLFIADHYGFRTVRRP